MPITVDFAIKKGSRLPRLLRTIEDNNGPVLIQGATATFFMRDLTTGAVKVNGATATVLDDGTATKKGQVEYAWAAADVDTPGIYEGEFRVISAGVPLIAPGEGYIVIQVWDDVAA